MVYPGKNSNLDFFLVCALRSAIFLSGRNSLLKNSKNPTKRWFFVLFSILVHLEFDENENRNQVERLHFHWIFDNLVPSEFLRLRRISLSSARSEKKIRKKFYAILFYQSIRKKCSTNPWPSSKMIRAINIVNLLFCGVLLNHIIQIIKFFFYNCNIFWMYLSPSLQVQWIFQIFRSVFAFFVDYLINWFWLVLFISILISDWSNLFLHHINSYSFSFLISPRTI